MSRDPFEELFGPLNDDANDASGTDAGRSETPTAPLPTSRPAARQPVLPQPVAPQPAAAQSSEPVPGVRRGQQPAAEPVTAAAPMPARQRLAHEQAERVHTNQGPTAKKKAPMPWIIVGAVAVVAIILSIVVVNVVRGAESAPQATPPSSNTTETTPQTPEATPDTEQPETPVKPEPEPEKKDEAPQVDVGEVTSMPIGPWNSASQISTRFGMVYYAIPDNVNLELTSELLSSFPEECAAMRTAWGATRLDDGTIQIRKPAESCAAAPELYNEVWGLVAAWIGTIQPQ
ncbi:hypothetical protein ACXR2W_05240 [Leucobacter sp. HY1908]